MSGVSDATSPAARFANRLRAFGELECRNSSPLYERLAMAAADDDQLLQALAPALGPRSNANVLFAAVHYLLLEGVADRLAKSYPSLGGKDPGDPYPPFRDFCLSHLELVQELVATRITQTNEVGRCAFLYPALTTVAGSDPRPMSLVDAGAAAGLNLLADRYGYELSGQRGGDQSSPVRIRCQLEGKLRPEIGRAGLAIATRIGVDLMPIDVHDDHAVRWLQACIWPEHRERRALLDAAVEVARQDPPKLVEGNAVDIAFDILASAPSDSIPVLIEMTTFPYFTDDERSQWIDRISAFGRERDLVWVMSEGWTIMERLLADAAPWDHRGRVAMAGAVVTFIDGVRRERRLAMHGPHGQWLEWLEA